MCIRDRLIAASCPLHQAVFLFLHAVSYTHLDVYKRQVLKDGASAIYGADAVAGVVNIITRKDMQGAEAGVRYGQTFQGDGAETSADLAWGTQGERGSLMAALNFSEGKAVPMALSLIHI